MIDFPENPSPGTRVSDGSSVWVFDGAVWLREVNPGDLSGAGQDILEQCQEAAENAANSADNAALSAAEASAAADRAELAAASVGVGGGGTVSIPTYDEVVERSASFTIEDEDLPIYVNRQVEVTPSATNVAITLGEGCGFVLDGAAMQAGGSSVMLANATTAMMATASTGLEVSPKQRHNIPVTRRGGGVGVITAQWEGAEAALTASPALGTPVIYSASDTDDVADTSGAMFDAAFPTQTITLPAGNKRGLLVVAGLCAKTVLSGTRSSALTVGGVSRTIQLPFITNETTVGDLSLAMAVVAMGDSATDTTGITVVFTTNAAARESQFLHVWPILSDLDQVTPVEATDQKDSHVHGLLTDSANNARYIEFGITTLGSYRRVIAYMAFSTNAANTPTDLIGIVNHSLSPWWTPSSGAYNEGAARDHQVRMGYEERATASSVTMRGRRLGTTSATVTNNWAALALRPATTLTPSGLILTDDAAAPTLERQNQKGLLVVHSNGNRADFHGV